MRENKISWEAPCFSKLSNRYLSSSSAWAPTMALDVWWVVPYLLQAHHDKIRATDPSPDQLGIRANLRAVSQKIRGCGAIRTPPYADMWMDLTDEQ